ncbi:MAG: hypothetical protein LBI12_04910 [Treponema sp.]|jgi:hypothetical protein|nr:hypothetical protein [Treponema sp.]
MKQTLNTVVLLLVFLSALSCVSVSNSVPPEGRHIPDSFAGIVHGDRTGTQKEYDLLDHMGVKWNLHTFYWENIEPEQGVWNLGAYDAIVNNGIAADIKVLGVLAYGLTRSEGKTVRRYYVPPEQIPDFLEYVRRTAEHYRGRIGAWCIWNEPNAHFWTGTKEEFIELFRQAADVIKEVDSEAVLLGGAFNWGPVGLPTGFIRQFFESGAMEKADGAAFHPYELNPARSARLYNRFRRIAGDYGFGDNIWVTEVGYPTGGRYPTRVKEERFPEYIIKNWVLLTANGAKKIFWYHLFDPVERSGKNSEDFFGLVRSTEDYTSKGAEAFRLCAQYIPNSILFTRIPGQNRLPSSVRTFWFMKPDGGALVLWKDGLGSRQISLRLPGINHITHNIVSGSTSPTSLVNGTELAVNVDRNLIFITWQNDPDSLTGDQ